MSKPSEAPVSDGAPSEAMLVDDPSVPVETLVAALRRADNEELQIQAACALGDRLRFYQLESLPLDAMAILVQIVEHSGAPGKANKSWSELRFEAAVTLCEARHPGGRALLHCLSDPRRRFDAIKALSRVASDNDVKIVLRRIARGLLVSWPDRLAASAVLSAEGDEEHGQYFWHRLTSKWFAHKRALALHLLGDVRHPKAYSVLSELVNSTDPAERSVAIRALGHLADPQARALLAPLAARTNDEVLAADVSYALSLLPQT